MSTAAMTVLLGRFRVEATRSRAGGAEVVEARDGDAAATLVIVSGAGAGEDLQASLERTARYALGIAGIERPLATGWIARSPGDDAPPSSAPARTFAVAYARGGSSAEALIDAGPCEPAHVARIVEGVAGAVGALHDQGVAHGHLRPELVMLDGDRVSVAGFGVAQLAQALGGPRLGRDALPVAYRAPELRGPMPARPETWSDVWALGVLASELLAGAHAPEHVDVPSPAALGAALPDAARRHLDAALSPAVGSRPHDVRAWAAELARLLSSTGKVEQGDAGAARPAARTDPTEPAPAAPPVPESAPAPLDTAPDQPAEPSPPPAPTKPDVVVAPKPAPRPSMPPAREGPTLFVVLALVLGVLLMVGVVGAGIAMAVAVRKSSAATPATVAPSPTIGPAVPPPMTGDAGAESDAGAPSGPESVDDGSDAGTPTPPAAHATLAPDDAKAAIPIDAHTPVWGPPDALVTIVEFGDLDCPHTRHLFDVVSRLKARFGDDLRIAWHHRPIPSHPHARAAAEVAAALHDDRGDAAFWSMAQEMARSSDDSTDARLATWVGDAGGDRSKVATWRRDPSAAAVVDADLELAGRFNVRATPTLFVNGIRIEGYQSYGALAAVVRRELARARSSLASGVAKRALYATRVHDNLADEDNDAPPRSCPPVGRAPVRGPSDALVTVVEFSDFECPYCRRVQPTLDSLLAHHPQDVRLVWKNFPLAVHKQARPAASFALEAYARGGAPAFWRVQQLLFGAPSLDEPSLSLIAKSAGLDEAALLDAARKNAHTRDIDADVRLGDKLGVTGTPTFFINGRLLSGAQPLAEFETVVGEEILVTRHLVAVGTPRAKIYDAVCAMP